jgi:hypothetical protein
MSTTTRMTIGSWVSRHGPPPSKALDGRRTRQPALPRTAVIQFHQPVRFTTPGILNAQASSTLTMGPRSVSCVIIGGWIVEMMARHSYFAAKESMADSEGRFVAFLDILCFSSARPIANCC